MFVLYKRVAHNNLYVSSQSNFAAFLVASSPSNTENVDVAVVPNPVPPFLNNGYISLDNRLVQSQLIAVTMEIRPQSDTGLLLYNEIFDNHFCTCVARTQGHT